MSTTLPLQHKRVAFTGKLASMTRKQAQASVREAGGEPVTQVSRRTSLVVVGMLGWPLLADGSISSKLKRAEQLGVEVISEAEFLERIGLKECQAALHKTYPIEEVEDLVGISGQTLCRLQQFGLIRAVDGRYDFQDLVSLRALAALLTSGVRPQTIAASIKGLSRVLPNTDRPLAQMTIVAEHPRSLLAELRDSRIDAAGQLLLDFGDRHTPQPGATAAAIRHNAQRWLEQAQLLEEDERYSEAIEAYRRALALTPEDAVVHFNLGNVLRAVNRTSEAAGHYAQATRLQPKLACAWYNWADLNEELGDVTAAVDCLKQALAADSNYADAHFNLALCYHQLQRSQDAHRHFSAYLNLDAHSEWAACARQHLALAAVERLSAR